MRLPSPPTVSWSLSGFVVGVLVTLLATGILSHQGHSTPAPAFTPPPQVSTSVLYQRVVSIAQRQLGQFTQGKRLRIVSVKLLPVVSLEALSRPLTGLAKYRSVYLVFRLEDNPLGRAWRLRTAKADVFLLMKALYTSGLPVYDTLLVGRFPLQTGSTTRETQAVVAYETHDDALKIPWHRWGRENEGVLWSQLTYTSVDSRFA